MSYFNVRVYGLLINQDHQLLISDECEKNVFFTKFPGGGLEFGEGLIDALKREFMEECHFEIEVVSHFYTTDFFEKSSFNDSQIISIYYLVQAKKNALLDFNSKLSNFSSASKQCFRWIPMGLLTRDMVTFKTDKTVVDLLIKAFTP